MICTEANHENTVIYLLEQLGYTRYYGPYSCEEKS